MTRTLILIATGGLLAACQSTDPTVAVDDFNALAARVDALETDNADLTAQVATLDAAASDLETRLGAAESTLDALGVDVGALDTTVTTVEAELAALTDRVDGIQIDLPDDQPVQILQYLAEDATWTVGPDGDYQTIQAAVEAASRLRIAPAAELIIEVADGTYTFTDVVGLNHGDGDRISLIGNEVDPSAVVLSCPGITCVAAANNRVFGLLAGVTVQGDSSAGTVGVLAVAGGAVNLRNVVIDGFNNGIIARSGGLVAQVAADDDSPTDDSFIRVSNSVQNGLFVFDGGIVLTTDLEVEGSGQRGVNVSRAGIGVLVDSYVHDSGFSGFQSSTHGLIVANRSTAEANQDGYRALNGGYLDATQASAIDNARHGFFSHLAATTNATSATISGNGGWGVLADTTGWVRATSATFDTNGSGDISVTPDEVQPDNTFVLTAK